MAASKDDHLHLSFWPLEAFRSTYSSMCWAQNCGSQDFPKGQDLQQECHGLPGSNFKTVANICKTAKALERQLQHRCCLCRLKVGC